MLNVYCEQFGSVWEPAEGGYYVEVSDVYLVDTVEDKDDARVLIENEAEGDIVYRDSDSLIYYYENGQYDSDGSPLHEESEAILIAACDRDTGYIGAGQTWYVLDEDSPAPASETYIGYR